MLSYAQSTNVGKHIVFFGDTILCPIDQSVSVQLQTPLSQTTLQNFYNTLNVGNYQPIIKALKTYKQKYILDDWLFYQLIRTVAEAISPKSSNYQQYTLYKWFLLAKCGYATNIRIKNDKLLLYAQTDELIWAIPYYQVNGKQYVCLNYHDFGQIDFSKEQFVSFSISVPEAQQVFSYKINNIPDFKSDNYALRELQFDFKQKAYHLKILLNQHVQKIFANYPVVDYECYFNIPLSKKTYNSLMPLLKENIKKMDQKKGVDYLMHFTRNAFEFQTDTENFGKEKRLSPEQTLLYQQSDCEDRAALFFFLVKEIYNLPMIVLSYPEHITVAVQFGQPMANPIVYNGLNYWVCEPTPQQQDLRIGQMLPSLKNSKYDIVYAYQPTSIAFKNTPIITQK